MIFSTANVSSRLGFSKNRLLQILASIFMCYWTYTLVDTNDINNWILENVLVILFLAYLIFSHKHFKFSDLSYTLIFVFLMLHVYGSKYTYAENPFGFWLQEEFGFQRNHYDRIVHYNFGFLLAYPMRDAFLNYFNFSKRVSWLLPIEITLSFSGLYELIEWAVADVFFKEQGAAYLGSQGDIWDAQKDMFLAFSGSILIMIIVGIVKKSKKSITD